MKILVAVPHRGFDPTEFGVPIRHLQTRLAAEVVVASSTVPGDGSNRSSVCARADPIMLDGKGLYLLKWSMRADANGRKAYEEVLATGILEQPLAYRTLLDQGISEYDALLLPGGHCPDMREYLEDKELQELVRQFSATWGTTKPKPIAAVCHGVVVCARSGILTSLKVTALPSWMEALAFNLTRLWMGSYYKTYPETTVAKEVSEACGTFLPGPYGLGRDSPTEFSHAFTVRDGWLLTARWPGDCHKFAAELERMLADARALQTTNPSNV